MANITDEHNIRHHVEGLIRAAVKGIAKIPNPTARNELRSYIQSLRVNTDTAIADGRLLDAAVFLADFGRRALFWLGGDLPKAGDYLRRRPATTRCSPSPSSASRAAPPPPIRATSRAAPRSRRRPSGCARRR
jgi:hypothetical protein